VRSETEIARNPVSISSVAVEFARNVFDDFQGRQVLVLSAGKMADLAARALRSHGASLTLTNRTRARAEELAARVGGGVHDWNDLEGALVKADIVIASTGAQRPVLTREVMARVMRARRGRLICLIDIAVPRDVAPDVTKVDGVYVANIDDLQKEAARALEGRQTEAEQAEAIVEQEVGRFLQAFSGRQLGPTVTALRSHFLDTAHAEANKLILGMAHLDEKDRTRFVAAFDAFAKKMLHLPQLALKKDAGEALSLVDAVRKLFDLQASEALPDGDVSSQPAAVTTKVPGPGEPS
jgi:glutamyl-tRNA reductase